ncbi:DNA cytosine methyltransferase [Lachnoanaerobaculum orale]|uniref:DNA cytosine methyltransferase n=1 Tax=Lachnoanaerobaculum orale TaxID=979627 RepID=UPI002ED334C0
MKLGALFSGSGGFELAGQLVGFTPVWASEIEPFPILVTTKRFPRMLHLGDIKKQDPESDSAKYKMWGNGIALPCAKFVMERIAQELQRRSMKEITINVPDGTQLLHVLAVIDKGREIHYEAKFCDLRDGNTEYSLNSNDEKNIGESKGNV